MHVICFRSMEEINYTWVIVGTLVGFFSLAALLLIPVYRFLKREEKASEQWTRERMDDGGRRSNGA